MLNAEHITAEDLEDVAKEYFNVLCGHIAAALYKATHVSVRFSVPSFHWGRYSPENHKEQFVIRYTSGRNEAVELVHHVPVSQKGDNGAA
jgi:chemotaxis protein CheY-P-specific phosphatase CheC